MKKVLMTIACIFLLCMMTAAETETPALNYERENATWIYKGFDIVDSNAGSLLVLKYDFTNFSDEGFESVGWFYPTAYQNGFELENEFPNHDDDSYYLLQNATTKIKDSASLEVGYFYLLQNTTDPVDIEFETSEVEIKEQINITDEPVPDEQGITEQATFEQEADNVMSLEQRIADLEARVEALEEMLY